MSLKEQLEHLQQKSLQDIQKVVDLDALNQIRVEVLGKKGPITEVLRGMRDLSNEERPKVGAFANEIKSDLARNN